jgi:hypothetical protein
MSRFIIPHEELEKVIEHATAPSWNKGDMTQRNNILNYAAERLAGLITSPHTEVVIRWTGFYAGIIAKLSNVEGERMASAYSWFNVENRNQVDEFLERIGYKG